MGTILGLFTGNIKTYVITIAIAAIVVIVGTFSWKYKSALDSLNQAQTKNIELEKEKTALLQVNKQNQTFITNMQADLKKQEKIVNDFRLQKAKDDKKLSDLSKRIIAYGNQDDGPIAKVLKDAIEGILLHREGVQK